MYTPKLKLGVLLLAAPLLATLSGCAGRTIAHDPSYAPVLPPASAQARPQDGAIYHVSTGVSLFEDTKAHRVGDIITIVLQEKTSASKKATTTTGKNQSIDLPGPTLFGGPVVYNGKEILNNSVSQKRDFAGDGASSQSNSLTGNVAVTVSRVLPNGNLVVRGEKVISLNQGDEYIRIAGIVRPTDVDSNNMVSSTKVANAQITYGGNGVVDDSNKMGWLARFFNSEWWPL